MTFFDSTQLELSNPFVVMNIDKKYHDSVVILTLDGTLFGGPQSTQLCVTLKELLDEKRKDVLLDLSGLSWLSIAGTGILISALTSFRNQGGDIKLAGASPDVKEQLNNANFKSIFTQYDHIDAALAAY